MLNQSVLTDPSFCPHSLNKYASIMACGNGYMGIRATHEEDYTQQTRGMYLAGLYHRAGRNETTELINLPDVTGVEVELDGVNFTLLSGEILEWQRELAFANGELHRNVVWRSPDGKRYRLESRRFVSLDQLPLVAMRLSITPLDGAAQAVLKTGIDATQTNSGRQHLDEISVRVLTSTTCRVCMKRRTGRLKLLFRRFVSSPLRATAVSPPKSSPQRSSFSDYLAR